MPLVQIAVLLEKEQGVVSKYRFKLKNESSRFASEKEY
jgi:hypothetical protein